MKSFIRPELLLSLLIFASCQPGRNLKNEAEMQVSTSFWGEVNNKAVNLYTLDNGNGVQVKITNYGGIVTSIITNDKQGKPGDVVLGFDSLSPYLRGHPYFGALVGRYGNRIAGGKFSLDGIEYNLAKNNGNNHLHGGVTGFDKVVWEAEIVRDSSTVGLRLAYVSKDGEEGYPGELKVLVTYTLNRDGELDIRYKAETNRPTIINLTHHSYFNLAAKGDILDHFMQILAARYTQVDAELIPSGELPSVEGTPMDFRSPVKIGQRIDDVNGGYDHNYILTKGAGDFGLAAKVFDPGSGRIMEVYTDEPGLQFYSGNFLDGTLRGKGNMTYGKHNGFCLEAQHYPDSPNHPEFPPVVLKPGEVYRQHTLYRFSVMK